MFIANGFTFIFKRNVVKDVVNRKSIDDEKLVLNLLKVDNSLTGKRISENINQSERTIQRIFSL